MTDTLYSMAKTLHTHNNMQYRAEADSFFMIESAVLLGSYWGSQSNAVACDDSSS